MCVCVCTRHVCCINNNNNHHGDNYDNNVDIKMAVLSVCRFVFIMGTSIAMSFHSARCRAVPLSKLFTRILRRTTILFILGLALSNRGKGNIVPYMQIECSKVKQSKCEFV